MTGIVRAVDIGPVTLSNAAPLALIAGPCQLQTLDHALGIARAVAALCGDLGMPFVFKSSFDKANRTRHDSPRGPGIEAGLEILAAVRAEIGCPVLTDVHAPDQCARAAAHADVLQIPAFLCRQTDLLVAAGETGAAVNIKKGQFLAPGDMAHAAAKVAGTGNDRILLTERGASFGYNALVADMRNLPVMAETGYPVVFDATHSVQEPGALGGASGGARRFVAPLARAAVAAGCAAVFIETHEDPDSAPSDGPCMVPLDEMRGLLDVLVKIDGAAKSGAAGEI